MPAHLVAVMLFLPTSMAAVRAAQILAHVEANRTGGVISLTMPRGGKAALMAWWQEWGVR
jgi:hypothetical protein